MKKITSAILVVIMLCLSVSTLASCGARTDDGAHISVYLGEEVFDFDPTDYIVSDNAAELMSLLFEPLFRLTPSGKLENAAAQGYSVNESEREIVVTLRESYWSDKTVVTAEDFIYAWRNVLLEPGNANPAAALLYDIEGAAAIKSGEASIYAFGVEKTDVFELTIKYREGADYRQLLKNLASVATAPVRQDIHENSPATWTKNITTAVTNGPFMIASINHEEGRFTVNRNVGYHQSPFLADKTGQVTPESLISFIIGGEDTYLTYSDVANKTVFYLGEAPLSDLSANKDKAKTANALSTYSYVFNTVDNELLAIKEVRQALSMVIDREAIASAVTFGEAATGFLPGGVLDLKTGKSFGSGELVATTSQLAAAKALLEGVDLSGLDKSIDITVNNDERSLAIAALVKTAWENLGIGLSVSIVAVDKIVSEVVDFSSGETVEISDSAIQALVKDAAKGIRNFDVIAIDWQMYSQDAFVPLVSFTSSMNGNGIDFSNADSARKNISGWWSFEYDTLMNNAYNTTDKNVRSESLHAAEKLLVESAPIVPILFNTNYAFVSSDLSGITNDVYGYFSFTRVNQKNYQDYLEEE